MQSNPKDKELWQRLVVALDDLEQARSFANHLLKKGWHHHASTRKRSIYFQQSAFTTAFVVAYGRVFLKSRGWPSVPDRIAKRTPEQEVLHSQILELRNEVYAHSDVNRQQIRKMDFFGLSFPLKAQQSMHLSREQLQSAIQMIGTIQKNMRARIEALSENFPGEA